MLKVLIACEESQRVCTEFRKLGHEAYSCDIIEPSGGRPEWHILGDCIPLLNGRCSFKTMDGAEHSIDGKWDMIIAHPPCTYLSNVGTRHFSTRCTPPEKVIDRWERRSMSAVFFMRFIGADCERIAVENPVGFMSRAYEKPTQIIQPYQFAETEDDTENYVTKATCLWLKGLPRLTVNRLSKPDNARIYGIMPSGKNRTWEDTYSRKASDRSKTFPGIAKAMAEQWTDYIEKEKINGTA